ncbi:MAG TPA: DHHW family protein [Anaerovoracaceae bacterium]|nr:DHHW family protein [Anaerovoracaceae bacterium]
MKMNKMKQIITVAVFMAVIFGFGIMHFVIKDGDTSASEKRLLAQLPEFTNEAVLSGEFETDFETYLLDQFPMRDDFRRIKAELKLGLLNQSDNNGVYVIDDAIYKWENKTDKKQIQYFIDKINAICSEHLRGNDVYYSIIPDKNYFVAGKNGYPDIDYDVLMGMVNEGIESGEYINIFPKLEIEDYYRTDAHWKQESLEGVVTTIGKAMGVGSRLADWNQYEEKTLYPFYGVYSGQAALSIKPDTITYLENDVTRNAVLTGAEFQGKTTVYSTDDLKMDSYNLFLKGPQAVLEINNPKAGTNKELIIFRDSFGSSLAPLLIDAYSKITLIDLRYLSSDFVSEFVSFGNADVLFVYSTSLVNSGMLLK